MGDVVRTTTEPQVGAIRLAWWRERLEELDRGIGPPAEPRLKAVAAELLPRSVRGSELARLERGWLSLFDPFPWEVATSEAIWFRGRLLFTAGAQLLAQTNDEIEEAGGLWAMVDVARACSDSASRSMLLGQAQIFARRLLGTRFPASLRPLSMLAALAVRDLRRGEPFEMEGSPARAGAMLRHRLSGRLPKLT